MECKHEKIHRIKNGHDRSGIQKYKCKLCGSSFKDPAVNCVHPKDKCRKNGSDSRGIKRFKCSICNKTFSLETRDRSIAMDLTRIILHLVLAGYEESEIALKLQLDLKQIIKVKNIYLKNSEQILPSKPFLAINTLFEIYRGIENGKITRLNSLENIGRRLIKQQAIRVRRR